jgi:IS605 OrfB family transposase
LWQEGTAKGQPWHRNYLTLHCTVDTRLWTAEGTEQVKQEKTDKITKTLTNMEEKGDLSQNQKAFIKRKKTTRDRLENSYPRPSQPVYQGQSHLLLGVAFRLEKPVTIAIVDGRTGKAITYRSIKQLLGKNYQLLNRQRQTKKQQSHQRHKNQKKFAPNQLKNSELGEYIDHLIAQEIVNLAQTYKVGSIVIPKFENIRELIQSEVKMRAEQKVPGYIEGQKKYAKQYRIEVHQWSYGRLIETIKSKANQGGLTIEQNKQPIRVSPQEEAKELAILAYQAR